MNGLADGLGCLSLAKRFSDQLIHVHGNRAVLHSSPPRHAWVRWASQDQAEIIGWVLADWVGMLTPVPAQMITPTPNPQQ